MLYYWRTSYFAGLASSQFGDTPIGRRRFPENLQPAGVFLSYTTDAVRASVSVKSFGNAAGETLDVSVKRCAGVGLFLWYTALALSLTRGAYIRPYTGTFLR